MTMQFDFHLIGADAPEGELDADQLIALVGSLKEVATRIGRIETQAERLGRAPNRTVRVARLTIGLAAGSTTLRMHRTGIADALDFDSDEEESFDERFAELVESFARNQRPAWVGESLSIATSHVIQALQQSARSVDFVVDGTSRSTFETGDLRRDVWEASRQPGIDEVEFTGTLYSANLHTHRFQVEDAVGNRVTLPAVVDDAEARRLLGAVVQVTGVPDYDSAGVLTSIRRASITSADPVTGAGIGPAVALNDILRAAPTPDPDGGIDLTDAEFDAFLDVLRG